MTHVDFIDFSAMIPEAVVADTFSAAEDTVEESSDEDSQQPQQQATERSAYLTFIERVSALCTLKRKDALDTSSNSSNSTDSSDSTGTATATAVTAAGGKMARGRSWMSGRLGRSKKGSDQVRFLGVAL